MRREGLVMMRGSAKRSAGMEFKDCIAMIAATFMVILPGLMIAIAAALASLLVIPLWI
jgi:hypothetical protein